MAYPTKQKLGLEFGLQTADAGTQTYHHWQRPRGLQAAFKRHVLLKCCLIGLVSLAMIRRMPMQWTGGYSRKTCTMTPEAAQELFLTIPNTQSALEASRLYATHPHLAGSVEDFADARTILALFQSELNVAAPPAPPIFSAGSPASQAATRGVPHLSAPAAWIDIYYPVLDTPLNHSLDILGADGTISASLALEEVGDPRDPEAYKYQDAVSAWHGLSADGDVTGRLVYANYGSREDFAELVDRGVNITDKIVLVRYFGALTRGLKVLHAQDLGAAGVLIYSDPRDDGRVTVANGYAPYPAGPARNPSSVQRGTVQFMSIYPGDPTTPGTPAYEHANRTASTNIPRIPSLPLSWATAQRVLAELGGDRTGRVLSGVVSNSSFRLVNRVNTTVTPIWNVYAALPGRVRDEVVVVGCHRDAWVMGAADPTAGTVAVREIVRGVGHLLRSGWTPQRTILFVSFDAEEYGLVGSTEWGEDFADWIATHAVAYLNVDAPLSGALWFAIGSPLLTPLIRANALRVPHPSDANRSLWDARGDSGPFEEGKIDADLAASLLHTAERTRKLEDDTGIPSLGGGSDFVVFQHHLGVPAMDGGFTQTLSDAVYHYHSIYDSQHWQEVYGDPGFRRHVAMAKHLGLMTLSLADAVVLPLNTTQYTHDLDKYLDSAIELAAGASLALPDDFGQLRRAICRLRHASAVLDEEKARVERDYQDALRQLERYQRHRAGGFLHGIARVTRRLWSGWRIDVDEVQCFKNTPWNAGLRAALGTEAGIVDEQDRRARDFAKAACHVRRVNKKLMSFERGFISEDGIKGREWYRHLGVAPSKETNVGEATLPAITEAITYEDARRVKEEVYRLSKMLHKLAETIMS